MKTPAIAFLGVFLIQGLSVAQEIPEKPTLEFAELHIEDGYYFVKHAGMVKSSVRVPTQCSVPVVVDSVEVVDGEEKAISKVIYESQKIMIDRVIEEPGTVIARFKVSEITVETVAKQTVDTAKLRKRLKKPRTVVLLRGEEQLSPFFAGALKPSTLVVRINGGGQHKSLTGFEFQLREELSRLVTGFASQPVNRNTARQAWYAIFPENAPTGGVFKSGAHTFHLPYNYGDTWFSRYRKMVQKHKQQQRIASKPPTVIDENSEKLVQPAFYLEPNPGRR